LAILFPYIAILYVIDSIQYTKKHEDFKKTIDELEMEIRVSRVRVRRPHAGGHGRADGHAFLCQSESCHFPWHKWHP
jgi:hypothetical protein